MRLRILTYAGAVAEWTAAGCPTRSPEETEAIFRTFCRSCLLYNKPLRQCRECGCPGRADRYGRLQQDQDGDATLSQGEVVMGAFTRSAWNSIIDQINALIASCGSGVAPLSEVAPAHIWTVQDILAVRSTLTQLCTSSNPSFSAVTVKWTQAIIDEINAAIAGCQCGPIVFNVPTQTSDTTTNLGTLYQNINRIYYIDPTTLQLVPALCAGRAPRSSPTRPLATATTSPPSGQSQSIATAR